jgi:hypothetical protein
MSDDPVNRLADFTKECKKNKLRVFFLYLSLNKMLIKYGINSNGIDSIPLFTFKLMKFKTIIKFQVLYKKQIALL